MKKFLPVSVASTAIYLVTTSQASAQSVSVCPAGQFASLCNISIGQFIGNLISFIFIIAAIVALLYLIWGGFKWITSGGDKTNIETARSHIIAAVVGLIIIFLSYVILNLVWTFFFGSSLTGSLNLPHL